MHSINIIFTCCILFVPIPHISSEDQTKNVARRSYEMYSKNSNNRYFNDVIDKFNLKTAIQQQQAEGKGKFFDINDFDCK